jgi:hypothetical protein
MLRNRTGVEPIFIIDKTQKQWPSVIMQSNQQQNMP